ncbi:MULTISPECIES: hypothetical protein [Halorubrum]|uniref:Uncharacterized protein n=1 Tax=Halorubrum persicum TaxID=1383844 RepID=A0A2G1WM40_9EURY|nr:hypothetical protein [Halorubrum persicum]PHQ40036.1 hypothetical protein DJ69_03435 [Halorubrum persicum]
MRRRSLLVGLSATLGTLAGCNTTGNESTDPAGTSGPTTDSGFAGMSVPDLPGENEVTWYHESDETTQGFVRPSTERTELPAQIDFTYHNRSQESTSCGHWSLYKLRDDRWFLVGPYGHDGICHNLPAGESETWTIAAATGEVDDGDADRYPYLGGGRYAAVAGYGHATAKSAALVEFDAPPVSVVSTDDATSDSNGSAVTVTADRWRTADGGERATLTLERAQTAGRTLIVEQVMRHPNRGYRNLLAFVDEDVERVVLRTDRQTADWIVDDGETARVRYDDQAYSVTKSEP